MEISKKIQWLIFDSGLTTYKIAQDLDMNVQTLDKYKNDPTKILGMALWRAEKISRYIDSVISEKELTQKLSEPKNVKEIVDVYNRKLLVDDSKRKLISYKNADQQIRYAAPIVENGEVTDFWTDYLSKGTVEDLESKLRVWNNVVLKSYGDRVNLNSVENDPNNKLWNDLVEYVKSHENDFFDKNGDWLDNKLIKLDFKKLKEK